MKKFIVHWLGVVKDVFVFAVLVSFVVGAIAFLVWLDRVRFVL